MCSCVLSPTHHRHPRASVAARPCQQRFSSSRSIIMLAQLSDALGKVMGPRTSAVSASMPKARKGLGLELLYYGIVLLGSAALSKFIIDQLDPFGQRKARQKVRNAGDICHGAHLAQSLLKKKELHRRLGRWVDTEPYEDVRSAIPPRNAHTTPSSSDGRGGHGHQPSAGGRHPQGRRRPAGGHRQAGMCCQPDRRASTSSTAQQRAAAAVQARTLQGHLPAACSRPAALRTTRHWQNHARQGSLVVHVHRPRKHHSSGVGKGEWRVLHERPCKSHSEQVVWRHAKACQCHL